MPRSPDEVLDGGTTAVAAAQDPAATASPVFRITVVDGPDRGASVSIDATRPAPLLVGHSPACDLRLSDRTASRRHASFDVIDQRVQLTDLGSTNGTTVNGISVNGARLRGGETVRIGQTTLRVELESESAVRPVSRATSFGRAIGASPEMRRLYPLCERLAATMLPVVIEGETGTGKELLAESLHEEGPRAAGPFIVFDCTAVPPNLVESELFGHEKGAFTGAVATRKGVFELAHGGTLLIDEIGDLEPALQPKLLRAIERSEVRRVGGDRPIRVDVRVLAATRRDLDHEVQVGRFRDDLFHRLAVARIEVPSLRRRRGDVPLLAAAFARQLGAPDGALTEALLQRWQDYAWPGNVRELRNAVSRYLALGEEEPAQGAPGGGAAQGGQPGQGALEAVLALGLPFSAARQRVLLEFDRAYVARVLAEHGGNVMRAAAASGIARRHLQRVKARSQK
ncbi:MAG TPA: sigma 54-interacting transcriptional regulator [Polyangiaceae bacterium]